MLVTLYFEVFDRLHNMNHALMTKGVSVNISHENLRSTRMISAYIQLTGASYNFPKLIYTGTAASMYTSTNLRLGVPGSAVHYHQLRPHQPQVVHDGVPELGPVVGLK